MSETPRFTPAHRDESIYWIASEGTRGSRMRDAIMAALDEIDRLTDERDDLMGKLRTWQAFSEALQTKVQP